jgi:quercetin dioxygenase-like cupin family protein
MRDRTLTILASIVVALAAAVWRVGSVDAQAPAGFKRVELQRHDLAVAGRELVMTRNEFDPAAAVPKHTHPGDEVGYVLEGEITVEVEGKPPAILKAGETFFVPARTVHGAKNTGKTPAKVLSSYLVEKGKPLATPVK